MSTNLYLNNEVKKSNGFKSTPYPDHSGDNMTINGMNVFGAKGRLYLMWNEDDPIPEELKDLVEEISCRKTIPQMGRREAGIYRHGTAECELTPDDYGNGKREKPVYTLKITAKNMEDIKEVLHKVKIGTIRPDESYEGPQGGRSRRQLESELLEAQATIRGNAKKLEALQTLREKISSLYRLAGSFLDHPFWSPLVFKSNVTSKMDEILNGE
jgi:hypothetical protein